MNTLLRKFLLSAAFLLCCTALANAANPDTVIIDGIYYILDRDNGIATVTWGGEDSYSCTEGYSGDIVIPEKAWGHTVTSIGDSAFLDCSGLTSITIPNSVTSIGEHAFENCSGLKSITIPNSVTSIEIGAFTGCSGLTSITIPNSVTSIGNKAFAQCPKLKSVYVSWETPLAIGDNVFRNLSTSEITLHIPYGTLDAYSTANVWNTFDLDGIISFADANAEKISVTKWDTDHDNLLSTKEAAAVTDLGNVFSGKAITSFNELKYFTGLTGIGANAFKGTSITSIEIPPTITSIGEGAFEECANLKYVTIPATVTSIGDNAFKGCTGLEEIDVKVQKPLSISSNVFENVATTCLLRVPYGSVTSYQEADVWKDFTNIQDNAIQFKDSEVEAICLANWDTNKDGALNYDEAAAVKIIDYYIDTEFTFNSNITSFDELKYFTGLKEIGERAFKNCTGLTSITIPNSVTSIGSNAFYGCTGLTSVTIPSSVTDIGRSAFEDCKGLTSITIPNSVTSIGNGAFSGCTELTSVTIPNSVKTIGSNAFEGCTNLQNVNINVLDFANNNVIYDRFNSDETIKYYYNGEEISGELTIPNTTASIGNNALKGVTGLTSVTIPNSVTSIGSSAFYGCTGLTSVTIPNSVTSIGSSAFYGCTGLTSVTIPNSVTGIGNDAFRGCTGLTSVTIPNSVTSIGNDAFNGCTGLETVSVQWTEADKIPDISGKDVFKEITLTDVSLDIPYKKGNIRPLYAAMDVWKDFNIVFAKNFIITKSDNTTIEHKVSENSYIVIDESKNDIKNIFVYDNAPSVKSITYTRDFSAVIGKWQTWFVPFEAPLSVLNDASIDAAEVAGILLDDEGETIVAFKKIEGDSKKMHANTPYVVRMGNDATTIATLVFENANLKETAESEYYAMSMYDKFTFTGNYESKHVDDSYTLNKNGEFQQMNENVNLKPMRFSLAVTPRDDSPYGNDPAGQAPKSAIRYMVLGDDSTLQPIDEDGRTGIKPATTPANSFRRSQQPMRIYDLRGRKVNRIQSKQVYIIDGKTYTAR